MNGEKLKPRIDFARPLEAPREPAPALHDALLLIVGDTGPTSGSLTKTILFIISCDKLAQRAA